MNTKLSKIISLLLVLSLLLSACSSGGGGTAKGTVLSPENTSATAAGITVDVGDYVLDGEAELSVSKGKTEDHSEDGHPAEQYSQKRHLYRSL